MSYDTKQRPRLWRCPVCGARPGGDCYNGHCADQLRETVRRASEALERLEAERELASDASHELDREIEW